MYENINNTYIIKMLATDRKYIYSYWTSHSQCSRCVSIILLWINSFIIKLHPRIKMTGDDEEEQTVYNTMLIFDNDNKWVSD